MKKLFVTLMMCLLTSTALWAQDSKWGIGLNLGYGTDVFGGQAFLGGRVLYDIDPRFDVVGSFNRYFKEYGAKVWDINADFHWNVYHHRVFEVYPLIGLTYMHTKWGSAKDGAFGVNLGGGGMVNITDHWHVPLLTAEKKQRNRTYRQAAAARTAVHAQLRQDGAAAVVSGTLTDKLSFKRYQ